MNIDRRQALRRLGSLGAGVVLPGSVLRVQDSNLVVAGRPAEIAVSSLGPLTVRVSVLPLGSSRDEIPMDGSLAPGLLPSSIGGDLVVRYDATPPTISIQRRNGEPVQRLGLSRETGSVSFRLGEAAILGMGQGGPQFDRRGSVDEMKSGQGGYRLRTHGGRVPIQWLVGTDGWAMFIHRPLGTFDLTGSPGKEGRFEPFGELLPLDVFVVGSRDPLEIMRSTRA